MTQFLHRPKGWDITGHDSYILTNRNIGLRMRHLWLVVVLVGAPAVLAAQRAAPAAAPIEIGAVAPDFTMNGATRYGVLARPIHLSDFKGKTVVLAFFFKARTSG
jgi:hypothetical protein